MFSSVALWSDSTYGMLEEERVEEVAKELRFPLSNYMCAFGAGLATKGDESRKTREVADMVIVEMGYNDPARLTKDAALNQIQKQVWFNVLSDGRSKVRRVVFVNQPSYRQVAGARKRKGKKASKQWTHGEMVDGSQFLVELAANLVCKVFKLDTQVLDWPGQELYVGFAIDDDGELWQDFAHCCSYTVSGVDYTAKMNWRCGMMPNTQLQQVPKPIFGA